MRVPLAELFPVISRLPARRGEPRGSDAHPRGGRVPAGHLVAPPASARGLTGWRTPSASSEAAVAAIIRLQRTGRATKNRLLVVLTCLTCGRRGPLAVLNPAVLGHRTTACLVEVDYLSSPRGEDRLADPAQRAAIGAAIASAIQEHVAHHAPGGSRRAAYLTWARDARTGNRNGSRHQPAFASAPDGCRASHRLRNQAHRCSAGSPYRRTEQRICKIRKPCSLCRIQSYRRDPAQRDRRRS